MKTVETALHCGLILTQLVPSNKVYITYTGSMNDPILYTATPQTAPYQTGLVWIYEGLICWKPGWIKVHLATLTGDKLAHRAHTQRNSQHASVVCSIISWRGYLERFKIAFTTWALTVLRMTSGSMAAIKRPISSSVYGLVGSCCLAQTEI